LPTLGIQRRLKSIRRFRHIAVVLGKYGFGEVLRRIHLPHGITLVGRHAAARAGGPERLVMALEELGPTFVKFGQILSTRSYLLPAEYASALARLQDEVSPFPVEDVKRIIREDFGKGTEDLFASFDDTPMASASVAQVHRATLTTGEDVVVKVRRPGVRETLEVDIMILHELAGLLENHVPEARRFDPEGIVREFERTSRREIDFTTEAANLDVFRHNFADVPDIHIPEVYHDLSTSRVLTTEYVHGIKISNVEELKKAHVDPAAVARLGAGAVLKQVFEDGLFHADPHPGNLFVTPDGKIAAVDFGIVGRLTPQEMDDLAEFFIAIVKGDGERLLAALEKMNVLPAEADRRSALEDAMLFLDKYRSRDLGDHNIKQMFREMIYFMRRYRVRVKTELLLLGKALGTYEDVGRKLDPSFNMMRESRPYVEKMIRKKYGLSSLLKGRSLGELISRLSSIPTDLANIMALAKEGKLKIEFEHVGLEQLTGQIERSGNRLSFSMIIAALVVASSLILVLGRGVLTERGLAIAGFALSAVVAAWLLISVIRSGRV
jgi:ubiquinone biosynthesis protein